LAEHIRTGCRELPDPTPESVFDNVHVNLPDDLDEQRTEFVDFVTAVSTS
jgi:pyruvate dehydrogenase E1 component alpha subunit